MWGWERGEAACGVARGRRADTHSSSLSASPQNLIERILRLDVEGCLKLLDDIFPVTPDPTLGLNFGEPAGPRGVGTYEAEHRTLFAPIRRLFGLVREISGMIQHEVGAFG